jgi:predicted ATPase
MLRKMENDERRPSAQIAELIANSLDIPATEREIFVRVALGELAVNRLTSASKQAALAHHANLPVSPMPLIGRQSEVDELDKVLSDPQCRMLTLTGPGGIGKTRLAIETASQHQPDFADGVYFVPLAHVQAARFIIPMIADSIGFAFQGESSVDPKSQLFNYLDEKQILLLVDNLEHLLGDPAVVDYFAELLKCARRVKLLVTSRESLGLQGEWVFEVHGLPIPESANVEGAAIGGTAVELFLQRARRAYVRFDATAGDYPAIVRICKLVSGMPLGIELAAAWVRTLSCDEIAGEIERGLDFLSASAKDLPVRHRSLRAVFDHSWKLLAGEEKKVLLQLSAFQGGFQRQAAQQVADASLATLSALVTKSLVRRSGIGRYDLHELVRQYTFEQLASHPEIQEESQRRHGQYFMSWLSQQDARLRSSAQRESLAELTADIDNIRSAQEWALVHQDYALIETALRACSAFFDTLGWAQEGLDYLGRVQAALESKSSLCRTEQVALAHVLTVRSLFAFRAAQHEQARLMLERSLELLRPLNEPRILVEALNYLGSVKFIVGNFAGAAELFEEGLQIAREIGDQWYAALCQTELVGINLLTGKAENAHEQFLSAVGAWRRTGDLRFIAFGLNSFSMSAITFEKYEEARIALEESIEINRSIGDRWGLGNAHRGLGLVGQAQGKHNQAMDSFRKSLQIFTELGAHWEAARLLSGMGHSIFALGDDAEAERVWCESLRLALETHGLPIALESILGIAGVQAKHGDYPRALELLLIVTHHPAAIPKSKDRAGKLAAELKEKLTPGEIESAQIFVEDNLFESVVNEILGQAHGRGS